MFQTLDPRYFESWASRTIQGDTGRMVQTLDRSRGAYLGEAASEGRYERVRGHVHPGKLGDGVCEGVQVREGPRDEIEHVHEKVVKVLIKRGWVQAERCVKRLQRALRTGKANVTRVRCRPEVVYFLCWLAAVN